MDSINMAYVAGGIYFLGIYFHYIHVLTVLHLMEVENYNTNRILLHSIVWPWTVVMMLSEELFGNDDDEEDDER
tara:strand:+ start:184 stop:405 length:222 start_codon:yes stop_codon:yes gene_type:complete